MSTKKKPAKPVKEKPSDGVEVVEKKELTFSRNGVEAVLDIGDDVTINLTLIDGSTPVRLSEIDDVIAVLKRCKEAAK